MISVPIEMINVGERLRQDNGDIAGLTASIREHGLLHPIVIDANYNLIAGGRRLLAVKETGAEEIEVKMLGELTERELRILELEENIQRKDLTEIEKSRNWVELANVVAEKQKEEFHKKDLRNENQDETYRPATGRNVIGRPEGSRIPGSIKSVADEIGRPKQTLHADYQHVAAVEKYPVLADMPKSTAINMAAHLDNQPEPIREQIIEAKRMRNEDKAKEPPITEEQQKKRGAENFRKKIESYYNYLFMCGDREIEKYFDGISGINATISSGFASTVDMINGSINWLVQLRDEYERRIMNKNTSTGLRRVK